MKPIIAIPAILALLYRAYSRKSLTPSAIIVAALTATIHAVHPWSAPFALLGVFFLAGTAVTKVCGVTLTLGYQFLSLGGMDENCLLSEDMCYRLSMMSSLG